MERYMFFETNAGQETYVTPKCKTVNFHVQSLLCISTDFEQYDEEEI